MIQAAQRRRARGQARPSVRRTAATRGWTSHPSRLNWPERSYPRPSSLHPAPASARRAGRGAPDDVAGQQLRAPGPVVASEDLRSDRGLTPREYPTTDGESSRQSDAGGCAAILPILGSLPALFPYGSSLSGAGPRRRPDRRPLAPSHLPPAPVVTISSAGSGWADQRISALTCPRRVPIGSRGIARAAHAGRSSGAMDIEKK